MNIQERIKFVLQSEAEAISNINVTADFTLAVELMLECQGRIITTGIGKAGHIAKKFSATLCSTATPSDFLHPAEAAHGDLGMVCLLYTSPSPRDLSTSRMPSSA